ncbi:lipase family alpha/beta hydrolase [Hydrocarboniclastica marina]|uniref:AB hydrolase-1 domain-containing protein n=1 Tax=Hydrocarboniclastica marina TaxID=2259620 RepID=A0A4P7XM40_9ALTE|nr:alpha/beta fold hydrolase [Hydrocarboniclastica marina]QCF27077.1 hypothetical protein soil367_14680 [Hydrocarboniclastica marina]
MDLIEYETILPPRVRNRLREFGVVMDMARLPFAYLRPRHKARPKHRIILLPGYGAGDLSLKPLAMFLRRSGFNVRTWGLGLNDASMSRLYPRVRDRVRSEYERYGQPVILLGWSMGGVLAREVTRDHPEWVEHVITLGSPIIGGPKYTIFARLYQSRGRDLDQVEERIKARYRKPIERPVTALYSRTDGVVSWEACIDKWSPTVEHREVASSHIGMGFSRKVFDILLDLLDDVVEKKADVN